MRVLLVMGALVLLDADDEASCVSGTQPQAVGPREWKFGRTTQKLEPALKSYTTGEVTLVDSAGRDGQCH